VNNSGDKKFLWLSVSSCAHSNRNYYDLPCSFIMVNEKPTLCSIFHVNSVLLKNDLCMKLSCGLLIYETYIPVMFLSVS
jgi:hypothetical protein